MSMASDDRYARYDMRLYWIILLYVVCVFFFSSRRRHTRFDCDWSSDVCSSDLVVEPVQLLVRRRPADVAAGPGDEAVQREAHRVDELPQAANRSAARARRLAASTSRSFGGAVVTSAASRCPVMWATSSTARLKASSLACEGLVDPLTLRTYCRAAARISSSVAAGSKLWRVLMFRHMNGKLAAVLLRRDRLRLRLPPPGTHKPPGVRRRGGPPRGPPPGRPPLPGAPPEKPAGPAPPPSGGVGR